MADRPASPPAGPPPGRPVRWPRAPQSRLAFLVALLTLSAVFTAVLAYQAQDAARSHRATAERALQDYASFAALEFAVNAKEGIWNETATKLYQPADPSPMGHGPHWRAETLLPGIAPDPCDAPDTALFFFDLDIKTQKITASRNCAPPTVRAWVADTVAAYTLAYKPTSEMSALVSTVHGTPRLAAFVIHRDTCGTPINAYGFTTALAPFAARVFADIYRYYPLLPPVLVGKAPNDSMLSATVRDTMGYVLYRSAMQYPPTYSGRLVEEKFGGFAVTIALRPSIANRLVIGGLPRSRLPLLLVLVALSVGLVVAALLQLRREYDLARLRADFISSISHELRTPLAQVRMFAETLLLGRVRSETEHRRSLEIIDQEARRLTHLVENVLQFSRAERQLTRLAPEPTELAAQLRDAIEAFAPIAQARGVRVHAQLAEGLVANVDRGALRQTLINLLDNAVKYGPPGQRVTVTLAPAPAGPRARITVDDEGPGIAAGDRVRIWEPFYRLERDACSATAGSGIGLAVVSELVARHGGRVWVESAPSGGARFVVELPLCTDAPGPVESSDGVAAASAAEVTS